MRITGYFMSTMLLWAIPHLLFGQGSASVQLNVRIAQVQSLTVNENQHQVNLDFSSKEDFRRGVEVLQPAHIKVFSSGRFVVKVSAQGEVTNGRDAIPKGTLTLSSQASPGANIAPDLELGQKVALLPNQPQTLIKSPSHGTLSTAFDVRYHASGEGYAQLDNGVYSGTVIYTIEAD